VPLVESPHDHAWVVLESPARQPISSRSNAATPLPVTVGVTERDAVGPSDQRQSRLAVSRLWGRVVRFTTSHPPRSSRVVGPAPV